MDTRQLIEASATVVTITRLQAGDVYKRVVTPYTGDSAELRYGVVTDVMHNGTEGAVTALEVNAGYAGVQVESKVWASGKPVALYAATPLELAQHSDRIREAATRKVTEAAEALRKAREQQVLAEQVLGSIRQQGLTAPQVAVRELTSAVEGSLDG